MANTIGEIEMPLYVGLDVSQKTTAVCVVDQHGRRHWRGACATEPSAIASLVLRRAGADAKVRSSRTREIVGDGLVVALMQTE